MPMTQCVSIVLPSYNYAHHLDETINSIIAQSHTFWELLIVDDGSTDDSVMLAEAYARTDSRIRVLQHPDKGNHGLAASLRLGLDEARHSYVAFLESDDAWEADSLMDRLALVQLPETALVFNAPRFVVEDAHDTTYLDEVYAILKNVVACRPSSEVYAAELAALNLIPSFSCVIAKRTLLKQCDFDAPFAPVLDKWLWQQMAFLGACRYVDKPLTRWRLHAESYLSVACKEETPQQRKVWVEKTRHLIRRHRHEKMSVLLWAAMYCPMLHSAYMRFSLKVRAMGIGFIWKIAHRRSTRLLHIVMLCRRQGKRI